MRHHKITELRADIAPMQTDFAFLDCDPFSDLLCNAVEDVRHDCIDDCQDQILENDQQYNGAIELFLHDLEITLRESKDCEDASQAVSYIAENLQESLDSLCDVAELPKEKIRNMLDI